MLLSRFIVRIRRKAEWKDLENIQFGWKWCKSKGADKESMVIKKKLEPLQGNYVFRLKGIS
jgi:hypothetical protein